MSNARRDEVSVRVRNASDLTGDAPAPEASDARGPRRANLHPSGLRRVTERRVTHLLQRSGRLSRVELARMASLSVAAIGKIVDSLVSAGVIEKFSGEIPRTGPTLGRPAEYFVLARSRPRLVAIELGAQKTQVAALPIAGPVGDIQTAQFRTPSDIATFGRRLKAAMQMLDIDDPLAVVVSVPGVVDESAARVLYSPNVHWIEGTKLFEAVTEIIPARLAVVQEIRALALGYLIHADPHDSYLMVETGDGVGGALVIDGRLLTGPLPLAAELGHTQIPGNRRTCGCGGGGCLETLLSPRGLVRTARRKADGIGSWAELVSAFANQPPPEWMHSTLDHAANVIAGTLNVVGVSKVVLVGALPELGSGVVDYLNGAVNKAALWGRFGSIQVEAAPRRRLLGLARAALDRVVLAPTEAEVNQRRREREVDAV